MIKFKRHPGPGYVYVICDVCSGKYYRKDTIKVTDRYNYQYGKVVCKWDVDKTNPQNIPHRVREEAVTNPSYLRSEPSDTYVFPTNDDRVPGAPRNLRAFPSNIGDGVDLQWDGPFDCGSSGIIGYAIKRAYPQSSTLVIIDSNTESSSSYYNDDTADQSLKYEYRVAAINGAGTGAYSAPAYYPVLDGQSSYVYLGVSQTGSVLATSSGTYILLSPEV